MGARLGLDYDGFVSWVTIVVAVTPVLALLAYVYYEQRRRNDASKAKAVTEIDSQLWDVDPIQGNATSVHIEARWTGGRIAKVFLSCGPGVRNTMFGGSSRAVFRAGDKPLQAVLRWEPGTKEPSAYLHWTDAAGEKQQLTLRLGVSE